MAQDKQGISRELPTMGSVPLSGPFPFGRTKAFVLSRIRLRKLACTRYRDTTWKYMHAEFQAQQAKAMHLRRKGRIHFQGESSPMILPGEITIARRPL
jgi:hypothetical protein